MVKEIMEEIKRAEGEAEQSLENARYRAVYMIENAKKEAEKNKQETCEKQRADAEKELNQAKAKGEEYVINVEIQTRKLKDEIVKIVKEKEKDAVKLVISQIME